MNLDLRQSALDLCRKLNAPLCIVEPCMEAGAALMAQHMTGFVHEQRKLLAKERNVELAEHGLKSGTLANLNGK
jgi:hypothetical protein